MRKLALLIAFIIPITSVCGELPEIPWPSLERWRANFDKEYYCSIQEVATISSSDKRAQQLADLSVNYLKTMLHPAGNYLWLFEKWFGTYSKERFDTVLANFINIKKTLDEQASFSYRCRHETCEFNLVAYVSFYFDMPLKRVYLCPIFFERPEKSRAAVIIHELSHMVVNTDDRCSDTGMTIGCNYNKKYGKSSALSLARMFPNYAILAAQNYEYFAEDAAKAPAPPSSLQAPTFFRIVQ